MAENPRRSVREEDEFLMDCLLKKSNSEELPPHNNIHEVQSLHLHDPETLAVEYEAYRDNRWCFFTSRELKFESGVLVNRESEFGRWHCEGVFQDVRNGTKRPFAYKIREGRRLTKRTDWKMLEYVLDKNQKIPDLDREKEGSRLDEWVLWCIYTEKGPETDQTRGKDVLIMQAEDVGLPTNCEPSSDAVVEGPENADNVLLPHDNYDNPFTSDVDTFLEEYEKELRERLSVDPSKQIENMMKAHCLICECSQTPENKHHAIGEGNEFCHTSEHATHGDMGPEDVGPLPDEDSEGWEEGSDHPSGDQMSHSEDENWDTSESD